MNLFVGIWRLERDSFLGKGNFKLISKQKDRVHCVLSAMRLFNKMNDVLGVCPNTWSVESPRYYTS